MGTNKILIAGFVGGLVLFILGYLVWGMALASFFESNAGSASGVMKDSMAGIDYVYALIGCVAGGLLIAVIYGRWGGIKTFNTGAAAGAVIGLLMAAYVDLLMLGTTNIATLTSSIVDIVLSGIVMAVIGGVVAWMLGRGVPAMEKAAA